MVGVDGFILLLFDGYGIDVNKCGGWVLVG